MSFHDIRHKPYVYWRNVVTNGIQAAYYTESSTLDKLTVAQLLNQLPAISVFTVAPRLNMLILLDTI
jgi:hypothetical protein